MAKRSDDSENFIIEGTLTVINHPQNGSGSIEITDTVYTDLIRSNTITGVPIDINEVEFLQKIMSMNENNGSPSTPSANKFSFYIDGGLLKSINSSNTITTYQPTTTKGDLLTHDGTTQTRLPAGTNNYYLRSKSTEVSGLLWEKPTYDYIFSWDSIFLTETTYTLLHQFIYKGTNNTPTFTSINIISSKTLPTSYTYSFRLIDITNKLQIAEVTGLNNTTFTTINIASLSNIPTSSATLELHGKLSVKNKDGVMVNFFELVV